MGPGCPVGRHNGRSREHVAVEACDRPQAAVDANEVIGDAGLHDPLDQRPAACPAVGRLHPELHRPLAQAETRVERHLDVGIRCTVQRNCAPRKWNQRIGRVVPHEHFFKIAYAVVIGVRKPRIRAVCLLLAVEQTVMIVVLQVIRNPVIVRVRAVRIAIAVILVQIIEPIMVRIVAWLGVAAEEHILPPVRQPVVVDVGHAPVGRKEVGRHRYALQRIVPIQHVVEIFGGGAAVIEPVRGGNVCSDAAHDAGEGRFEVRLGRRRIERAPGDVGQPLKLKRIVLYVRAEPDRVDDDACVRALLDHIGRGIRVGLAVGNEYFYVFHGSMAVRVVEILRGVQRNSVVRIAPHLYGVDKRFQRSLVGEEPGGRQHCHRVVERDNAYRRAGRQRVDGSVGAILHIGKPVLERHAA